MRQVSLERLYPYLSNTSKNSIIGCLMLPRHSFNVDSSWTSWAMQIELVLVSLVESNFSWTWDWCHWKCYLILFLCIYRMSKSDFICILVVNLIARWSWTLSWIQSQTLEFQIGLVSNLNWMPFLVLCASKTLSNVLLIISKVHNNN
jgi:hypothetical protein